MLPVARAAGVHTGGNASVNTAQPGTLVANLEDLEAARLQVVPQPKLAQVEPEGLLRGGVLTGKPGEDSMQSTRPGRVGRTEAAP